MSFRKREIFLNGKKFNKIEIIEYPSIKGYEKTTIYDFPLNEKREINATEKCIEIICKHNQMSYQQLLGTKEKKSIQFYCPFHENLQTSHTKSGQLFIHDHRYICYSSKCVLPKNVNGKRLVSTVNFFLEYKKYEREKSIFPKH